MITESPELSPFFLKLNYPGPEKGSSISRMCRMGQLSFRYLSSDQNEQMNPSGIVSKGRFRFGPCRVRLRFGISNQLPGHAEAAGGGTKCGLPGSRPLSDKASHHVFSDRDQNPGAPQACGSQTSMSGASQS